LVFVAFGVLVGPRVWVGGLSVLVATGALVAVGAKVFAAGIGVDVRAGIDVDVRGGVGVSIPPV